jgi:integrase
MRGSVRRRGEPGSPWEYRVEYDTPQPAQRCPPCTEARHRPARWWLDGKPLGACPHCGGELVDVHERRQRSHSGFRTQKAAQAALNRAMTALATGEFVEPSKLTVREYLVTEWLPSIEASVRPSTFGSYKMICERYIVPRIGTVRLQKLGADAIGKLYADLLADGKVKRPKDEHNPQAEGETSHPAATAEETEPKKHPLSPMSVRHIHACLHRALADAVRRQRLARNPADAVDPPQVKASGRHELSTWTAEEVKTFLDATADDRLGGLWRLMVSNGLRRGEALGLQWKPDINLESGRLSVRRALVSAGYVVKTVEPKTKRGRRSMGLADETIIALRAQAALQLDDAAKHGDLWKDTGFVFTTETGEPWHPDRVSKLFDQAVKKAPVPRIRLHDLRHTCATLALQANIHPKVISEMLGHATIAITLDTYSHAIPAMQDEAVNRIAAQFSDTR